MAGDGRVRSTPIRNFTDTLTHARCNLRVTLVRFGHQELRGQHFTEIESPDVTGNRRTGVRTWLLRRK